MTISSKISIKTEMYFKTIYVCSIGATFSADAEAYSISRIAPIIRKMQVNVGIGIVYAKSASFTF